MRKDFAKEISDQVIQLMQEHGTDWAKPWMDQAGMGHKNAVSGKEYRGTNTFITALSSYKQGFSSNEWASFKQWQSKGAKVKKGQKGTHIIFYDSKVIEDRDTQEEKRIFILKGWPVFNADQVDGYEPKPIEKPANKVKPVDRVDQLVVNSAAIVKTGGNRAFYTKEQDFIQMPDPSAFTGTDTSTPQESYYSTLLHEMIHWSGHKSRLDRPLGNRFGSNAYAFEELIAEMGSVFAGIALGVNAEPRPDHAKYLNNWLQVLKENDRAMISAFGKAQKAADYLLQFDQQAEKAA